MEGLLKREPFRISQITRLMKAKDIPAYPSLNKYVASIFNYMEEHKFSSAPDYAEMEQQADRALDAFYEARLNGHSVEEAIEISNQVLFENIGESEYEIVEDILRNYFKDTVDLSDGWIDYWVNRILEDISDLFENCEILAYGVSAADIDINRDSIIGRITDYFTSNGL